jgi:hypothetical protein
MQQVTKTIKKFGRKRSSKLMRLCDLQFTGINLITYYSATLFQNNLHMSAELSRILSAAYVSKYPLAYTRWAIL